MKMMWFRSLGKDGIGGLLLAVIGAGVTARACFYPLGTVRRMGPGFMPAVYGTLMAVAGIAIILAASVQPREVPDAAAPDVRAALCILGGLFAFVAAGASLGLAPATFLAVFIAALGDRGNSLRDAGLLAGALAIIATAVFSYGLGLQLPLFRWF